MTPVTPPRGRLLSVKDGAAYLGMKPGRLRRLIGRGQIAVLRHPSGRVAGVYSADLDAWVERRRQPEQSARARQSVDDWMETILPPPSERVFSR
jgi:hypothetical protein